MIVVPCFLISTVVIFCFSGVLAENTVLEACQGFLNSTDNSFSVDNQLFKPSIFGACFVDCSERNCHCLNSLVSFGDVVTAQNTFNRTTGTCTIAPSLSTRENSFLDPSSVCSGYQECFRDFSECVAAASIVTHLDSNYGNLSETDCQSWATALAEPLLTYLKNQDQITYNSTIPFHSCRSYLCSDEYAAAYDAFLTNISSVVENTNDNVPQCRLPAMDCAAPFAVPDQGSESEGTPAPGGGTGGTSTPPSSIVANYNGTMRIPGTFRKFFAEAANSPEALSTMQQAVAWSIGNLTDGTNVVVSGLVEGSLVADFQFTTDVAKRAATAERLNKTSTRPGWIKSVQSVYQTYYPYVTLSPTAEVSFSVVFQNVASDIVPSTWSACGPRCVAGVVIGVVVFVGFLGAVLFTWYRGPQGFAIRSAEDKK
jgi:hypothetical protein